MYWFNKQTDCRLSSCWKEWLVPLEERMTVPVYVKYFCWNKIINKYKNTYYYNSINTKWRPYQRLTELWSEVVTVETPPCWDPAVVRERHCCRLLPERAATRTRLPGAAQTGARGRRSAARRLSQVPSVAAQLLTTPTSASRVALCLTYWWTSLLYTNCQPDNTVVLILWPFNNYNFKFKFLSLLF